MCENVCEAVGLKLLVVTLHKIAQFLAHLNKVYFSLHPLSENISRPNI